MYKSVFLGLYIVASILCGFTFHDLIGCENALLGSIVGFALGSVAFFFAFKPASELIFSSGRQ